MSKKSKTFDSSETDEQMVRVVEGESSSNKVHKKKKKKRRQSDYTEEVSRLICSVITYLGITLN